MTPERIAALVAAWARIYTRGLPPSIADRRREEIGADLHDQIADERGAGVPDRRIARSIAGRMIRGLAADLTWRGRMIGRSARRSVTRVALVTGLVLLVPLVGMQLDDGVNWTVADFVVAAVLLSGSGLLLELAASKPRNVSARFAAVALGVAAAAFGDADDAPGLVLLGCLLILGTVALTVRAARRRG